MCSQCVGASSQAADGRESEPSSLRGRREQEEPASAEEESADNPEGHSWLLDGLDVSR